MGCLVVCTAVWLALQPLYGAAEQSCSPAREQAGEGQNFLQDGSKSSSRVSMVTRSLCCLWCWVQG